MDITAPEMPFLFLPRNLTVFTRFVKRIDFIIMNRIKKAAVIGGDLRSIAAAERLREYGCETRLFGFAAKSGASKGAVDSLCCSSCAANDGLPSYIEQIGGLLAPDLDTALDGCDSVILPLPASNDKIHLTMPFSDTQLPLVELQRLMRWHNIELVCGGKLDKAFIESCESAGMTCFDYYEREEFAVANAVPTAEGAIAIAMNELAVTLDNSEILVVGFGRIGKMLSQKLSALGAKVTVSARRADDFAWIKALGLEYTETGKLADYFKLHAPAVVFNTVPHRVFGKSELDVIRKGTLIIDLASNPGGVDIQAAGAAGHRVIWALSLPGKTAPLTAGRIIADTVTGWLDSLPNEGGNV